MKKYLYLLYLLLFTLAGYSQQSPQFTFYKENRFIINPAATGISEDVNLNTGYRKQWAGLGNEPTTFYLGAHKGFLKTTPPAVQPLALRTVNPEEYKFTQKEEIKGKVKHGLGGYIMNDSYGKFKTIGFNLSYAAHVELTDNLNLGVGSKLGFNNFQFEGGDLLIDKNDPSYSRFATENNSKSMLDMNFGAYLYNENFYVGYSTNQLVGDKLSFGTSTVNALALHHYLITGYTYEINDELSFSPNIYLKAVGGAPLSYDINAIINYDNFFGGVTYRAEDAIAIMVGAKFNDMISISYAYDITTSNINNYSSGGHEINLGFIIK